MSKKLLVFAVMATLAFGATISMATASRIENLGNQGLYLADDTNIFTNPATVSYYSKVLFLHMGGYNGGGGSNTDMWAFGGATTPLPFMEGLTLGVAFARNPSFEEGGIGTIRTESFLGGAFWPWDFPGGDLPLDDVAATWHNPFDIILGYKMGDLSIGLSYYLANGRIKYTYNEDGNFDADSDTYFDEEVEVLSKAYLHSLKLGASYKMGNMQPEAWLNWDPYSVVTTTSWDADGQDAIDYETSLKGSKILLGARLFYNLNDNVAVVPAITWEHVTGNIGMDYEDDYDEDEYDISMKVNTINAGVSVQYKADKLLVVGSAGLLWSKFQVDLSDDVEDETYSYYSKSFAVPVVAMGLEYQAMKNITLRGGLKTTTVWSSSTYGEEYDNDDYDVSYDEEEMYSTQSTTASLGAALHFGNLVLDVTFGNLFLTGENGGNPAYGTAGPNLFSSLDATYVF